MRVGWPAGTYIFGNPRVVRYACQKITTLQETNLDVNKILFEHLKIHFKVVYYILRGKHITIHLSPTYKKFFQSMTTISFLISTSKQPNKIPY